MTGLGKALRGWAVSARKVQGYNFDMVNKELLEILVCPVCKKPLVEKDGGESLKCGECRRVYPVRDDIPILLIDEATTDPT
jgi:uncharacterized protein YbaR (Trm112 family)